MEGRQEKRGRHRERITQSKRKKQERHNIRSAKGQRGRKIVFSESQGATDLMEKTERFEDKGSICNR